MQRLEIRQGQSLVLTPQLLQAIKLLQLSHLELNAYVEAEFEKNPLLTYPDAGSSTQALSPDGSPERSVMTLPDGPDHVSIAAKDMSGFDRAQANRVTQTSLIRTGPISRGGGDRHAGPGFEESVALATDLAGHLERQLDLAVTDVQDRAIGRHLIHSLDESGYLTDNLADIAKRLGIPEARAQISLALIQTFDPPGIAARDLAECLSLQLREQNRLDPAMQALLTRLDLVAKRDIAALKRFCGVDDEDLADMLAEIRRLDPKPGSAFDTASPEYLMPDVLIRPGADGDWHIELNPETLPKVLIDQTYYVQVSASARREEDKAFLNECLQSANWLKRSLDQRAKTILKVAKEMVQQQDGFFRHGVSHLKPLTLKAVADAIGMHESTVSRVTANKVIGTSRGLFEMKYFFTAAISGASGADSHSSEAVRYRIKQLVDAEPANDVLSDDAIAQKLKSEGIDIARRTIAKYRDSLRIPSSSDRRRAKRA